MSTEKIKKPVIIREVYSENLESELNTISDIISKFPYISMDTEFPGVVVQSRRHDKSKKPTPESFYEMIKSNVDILNLIQLGITLTNANGELPDLNTDSCYVWQFNFKDFDPARDSHAPKSIVMLEKQGIDFEKNKEKGIESVRFGELVMASGLVCNEMDNTYVTFSGGYDFGYLVKILTHSPLPSSLTGFMDKIRVYFGKSVYDVKYMMCFCQGLYGGLEMVAGSLNVKRVVGMGHQAGSDSLLTWHVFDKMRAKYFPNNGYEKYAGVVGGLK